MKHNYLKSLFLMLMMCVGMSAWADSWTRCTSVSDLTSDGTFIIGYEATANSGKIIPMKNTGGTATTSTAGYMASGSEIDMATVTTTTDYEVSIVASTTVTGAICIKVGDNFIGNTDTKNNLKLFSEEANTTSFGVTVGTNDVFTLKIADNKTYHTLQYNTSSPRFAVYGGTQKNLVIYKKSIATPDTPDPTTVTAPTFDVAAGTYTEDKIVKVNNYDENYLYAYTTDGTDPAFDDKLDVTNGTEYDENQGIEITSSCTLKVIAVDMDGNASSITSAAYVINKPIVFASLEELVAANLTSGTNVTVSFENVAIKSIFTSSQSKRQGVYFDIQKDGHDIEIYYSSTEVPTEWVVGGTLSGTMTCPWTYYERGTTWELAPASGWAWTNLTYKAPVVTKENATINISGNKTSLAAGTSDSFSIDYNGDGELKAVSSQPQFATVALDGNTVTVTTVKAGTTTITITASETENFTAAEVKYTLTVIPTATLPFSFDGGVSNIAETKGMSQSGLGSDYSSSPKLKFDSAGDNIVINFNETAKKVTYTIKGNSTSGTYAFDVMESADGIEYTTIHSHTSITDATSYTDNLASTSRFVKFVYTTKANGNVALGKISIIAASSREEPNLAFNQATYKFIAGKDMQVEATSKAGSTGAITYALTAGDEEAFKIDENTGAITCNTAGNYTVTATIAENEDYYSGSTTCMVNVIEPLVGNSIIVAETDGGCYAMTTTCAGEYFGHKAINKVGDKYVVSSLDDILFYTSTVDGQTTIQSTSNNEYVQATAAKKISYTEDEYKWTNAEGILTAATPSHGTLQYNTSSPRFTTYATKVGQYATIVDLSNVIVGEVVTISVSPAGYATYYNADKYVMPEGLEGKIMKEVEGTVKSVVAYEAGAVVPAETALLLKGKAGKYPLIPTSKEGTKAEGNLLKGNLTEGLTTGGDADAKYYKFAKGDNGLGWYYGSSDNTDGHAFTIGANKAYLVINGSSEVKALSFVSIEDNEEDAIKNVEEKTFDTVIYDMQGRKVSMAQKGIYIINGRKMVK